MKGVYIGFHPNNVGSIWPPEAVQAEAKQVRAIPPDTTAFCHFFGPILDRLHALHWFATRYDSTPFVSLVYEDGGEERLDDVLISVLNSGGYDAVPGSQQSSTLQAIAGLYRPGTLPALAPYLYDDWIDLVGLDMPRDAAIEASRELARAADGRGYYDVIVRMSRILFFCVDGFSWELYAADENLISSVTAPLMGQKGLEVRFCELHERDSELFGNRGPGGDSQTTPAP